MKITARYMDSMKMSPEEVIDLARDVITNKGLVTSDPHIVQSAFFMMLAFTEITEAAAKRIGAFYGDYDKVVPGRGMNGYPIFTSVRFIHVNDIEPLHKEVERLHEALGIQPIREDQNDTARGTPSPESPGDAGKTRTRRRTNEELQAGTPRSRSQRSVPRSDTGRTRKSQGRKKASSGTTSRRSK